MKEHKNANPSGEAMKVSQSVEPQAAELEGSTTQLLHLNPSGFPKT